MRNGPEPEPGAVPRDNAQGSRIPAEPFPFAWTYVQMGWQDLTPQERAERASRFQASSTFRAWRLTVYDDLIERAEGRLVEVEARIAAGTATGQDRHLAEVALAELLGESREVAAHAETMRHLRDRDLSRLRRAQRRERARWTT